MKITMKKALCFLLLVTLMLSITQSAFATSSKAGQAVDIINDSMNELMNSVLSMIFDVKDVTISEDEFLAAKGTIYFNSDKTKILMAGEKTYKTLEFSDEAFYAMTVSTICMIYEMHDLTDYGIKIYWVNNSKTELLSESEISQIAAQLTTLLNN